MAAKTKKITVGDGNAASAINAQFNQLIGEGDLDPAIIKPKYNKLHKNISLVSQVFKNLADFVKNLKDTQYHKHAEQMHTIRLRWNEEMDENRKNPDLQSSYKSLKKCMTTNAMLELYGSLKKYEEFILNRNGEFIEDYPSEIFYIFRNVKLNFKDLYVYVGGDKKLKKEIQAYIMQSLKLICSATKNVYNLISSPDIDIASTAQFLHSALMDLQKHIPRCEQAFNKIRNSIGMLEGNFTEYYKDFLGTQDQTMIMQSFINDIMKNGKSNLKVMHQFKTIIKFLQEKASTSKSKDPRVKALFDKMNEMNKIAEEVKDEEPEESESETSVEIEEDLEAIKIADD